MRISANSSQRKNSQVSGGGGGVAKAFFMPQSLQDFINNNPEAINDNQAFKNDDMMDEKQSFHSGSLGNENLKTEQPFINMLNQQQPNQMRRQTLQVNPNILGQLDQQMYLQQQQFQ